MLPITWLTLNSCAVVEGRLWGSPGIGRRQGPHKEKSNCNCVFRFLASLEQNYPYVSSSILPDGYNHGIVKGGIWVHLMCNF